MAPRARSKRTAAARAAKTTAAQPRSVTAAKADPAKVKTYFDSTGLNRKQLAAAVGVSTSVIATVQNPNGDRWSQVRFDAARRLIDAYARDHASEVATARADARAKAQASAKAEADRVARRASRQPAKPAPVVKLAAAKTSARAKPGRPTAARRAANRASASA